MSTIIDALSAHIAILNEAGTVVAVNHAWRACAGGCEPFRGELGHNYMAACEAAEGADAPAGRAIAAGIRAVMAGSQPSFYLEYPCALRERQHWFALRATPLREGGQARTVVAHEDITARKQAEALARQLAHQAHHDTLTGLPNRLLFEEHLQQAIDGARRSGRMIAVLFVDLDRFKQINDTLGHAVGDDLLVQLAHRFAGYIRGADTLARRGGDEFMLVLNDIANPQQVAKVAQRLHELLQAPFHIAGHELFVSASIGASLFPADGADADSLQRRADAAMYRAKSTLLNSFQFFDAATTQSTVERLRLENYLRRALEHNELDVYYQPKVDRAGRIVSVEALLRWRHPELGMVPPARFIPLAEEIGLIIPIGAWCMARAFRQVRAWQRPGRPLRLSVNLSIIQFSQPDFIATLRALLAESDLDPSLLVLELTEGTLIGDHASVTQQLNNMRAIGLSLAIDDFGKGYSSLDYLRRLPISTLKIDRAFVADIGTDQNDSGRAIINSIVNLAHQLGMQVVAEGVETPAQRDFLHSIDCDIIQGYIYSEPLPPPLFEHLLDAGRLPSPLWKE